MSDLSYEELNKQIVENDMISEELTEILLFQISDYMEKKADSFRIQGHDKTLSLLLSVVIKLLIIILANNNEMEDVDEVKEYIQKNLSKSVEELNLKLKTNS